MATTQENNNTLYFIVGALVVLAVIFGMYFFNGKAVPENVMTSTSVEAPVTNAPATDQTTVTVDENGATVTQTDAP